MNRFLEKIKWKDVSVLTIIIIFLYGNAYNNNFILFQEYMQRNLFQNIRCDLFVRFKQLANHKKSQISWHMFDVVPTYSNNTFLGHESCHKMHGLPPLCWGLQPPVVRLRQGSATDLPWSGAIHAMAAMGGLCSGSWVTCQNFREIPWDTTGSYTCYAWFLMFLLWTCCGNDFVSYCIKKPDAEICFE